MVVKFSKNVSISSIDDIFWQTENESKKEDSLIFDMKNVTFFDINALISYSCFLKTLQNKDVKFKLALPNDKKVRDFLKGWKFYETLIENKDFPIKEIEGLLYEKKDVKLFREKQKNYLFDDINFDSPYSLLLSGHMLEIKNFIDSFEKNKISRLKIDEFIQEMGRPYRNTFLDKMLDAKEGNSGEFVRILLQESLLSMFDHPDATIALAAMAKEPVSKYQDNFILCVADNGENIPNTLRNFYSENPLGKKTPKPESNDSVWIKYATEMPEDFTIPNRPCAGLPYLKKMAVDGFNGGLSIGSGKYIVTFSESKNPHIETGIFDGNINSNLISLTLPMSKIEKYK